MNLRSAVLGLMFGTLSLAIFFWLLGWEGASRAYSIGAHVLLRDYIASVIAAATASLLLGVAAGWLLRAPKDVLQFVLSVVAAHILAALLVEVAIPEIRLTDMPRAVVTSTAYGIMTLATAGGALVGSFVGRRATSRVAS